ncbi:MAG: redox-regulated ATPase YchF [Thermofilaceae archaeon]|nr:redox-regulated ATPase YchF [Thermofilaceae archaeon]MDW8003761.1 redox-regulated ATPase YchF [Thermofilaceae archaeon]
MPKSFGVQVGIVGKPNTGKSTFFAAVTLQDVKIAPYPFTTIEPNVGIGYVKVKCVCEELGVRDNPVNSFCVKGWRFAPIELIDVAGLVPDAWQGRGLGNRFLDHLRRADALIHVVDASGSTDAEGRPVEPGSYDPLKDVEFLERELDMWIFEMLEREWKRFAMSVEATGAKLDEEIYRRLSGLEVNRDAISEAIEAADLVGKKPSLWSAEDILRFVRETRIRAKPMIIAANKADMPSSKANVERMREKLKNRYFVIPTSAEAELALRKASAAGLIKYVPGDKDFEVLGKLSAKQEMALEYIRKNVLETWGSTGVQDAINSTVLEVLGYVAVFPVADDQKLTDSEGRVLPEIYLMKRGSTARDLAYAVHSDLGDKFIAAVDVKTKKRIGASSPLYHRMVLRVIAGR